MIFNTILECAKYSLTVNDVETFECSIQLEEDGQIFEAYEVSIAHQDLLFFSENGCLNYVVDNYGDGNVKIELFNIEYGD